MISFFSPAKQMLFSSKNNKWDVCCSINWNSSARGIFLNNELSILSAAAGWLPTVFPDHIVTSRFIITSIVTPVSADFYFVFVRNFVIPVAIKIFNNVVSSSQVHQSQYSTDHGLKKAHSNCTYLTDELLLNMGSSVCSAHSIQQHVD